MSKLSPRLQQMIRVNQAGEYGAIRIYKGQMAVLGSLESLKTMEEEEQCHLKRFQDLLLRHSVRPTLLQPLWHVAGFALGAGTALLGEKAAHACTMAVEEEIDRHFQKQMMELSQNNENERELLETVQACHQDEVAHREQARALGGEEAPFYDVLSTSIRYLTRGAIWVSERI